MQLSQDPFLKMIDLVIDKHQMRVDAICKVYAQFDALKACGFNIKFNSIENSATTVFRITYPKSETVFDIVMHLDSDKGEYVLRDQARTEIKIDDVFPTVLNVFHNVDRIDKLHVHYQKYMRDHGA